MESIWTEQKMPEFPGLDGDRTTDVLIIGGGIAGILAVSALKEAGVDCLLVEKGRICRGNTGFTTAKITAQHGLCYQEIARTHGLEAARLYYEANQDALAEYARLAERYPCDFIRRDNYVYATDNPATLEAERKVLEKIGAEAALCTLLPLPISTVGAVRMANQAQFHPLKFLSGIARELPILENTFVREMAGTTAVTDRGRIRAKKVICASHFPFINKHGSYFLKLHQQRSYVLALENAPFPDGMYVDGSGNGPSFREQDGLLLLGGGGSRPGKDCGAWESLRQFAREHYKDAKEKYAWAAQDCMSLDAMPYVGRYSRRTPDFYVTTGFNKWGMTSAMVSAQLLRDQILGKENPLTALLDPSRSILRKQLLSNGLESAKGLLTPAKLTCPHLGCGLIWNEAEQSWDCPCHGSRFTAEGKLLENPANGDLEM